MYNEGIGQAITQAHFLKVHIMKNLTPAQRSANTLITLCDGNKELLQYHIKSQKEQLANLRPNGRLAQAKRDNIKDLERELKNCK